MFDQRGLARAVRADEAVDRPARHGEAHRAQGRLSAEAARQPRDLDDRFPHADLPLSLPVTTPGSPRSRSAQFLEQDMIWIARLSLGANPKPESPRIRPTS